MIENLGLIGTGFGVVMTVLAAIWGACSLVGSVFIRAERAAIAAKAVATPIAAPAAPAATTASGVPAHHLAAITAAVAHSLGSGYRIARIAAPPHKVGNWPMEGRFDTLTGRRARTNWGPTRVVPAGQPIK